MPVIAKCQPLHRPSTQSPPTIAAIFIFDIVADKVHLSMYLKFLNEATHSLLVMFAALL